MIPGENILARTRELFPGAPWKYICIGSYFEKKMLSVDMRADKIGSPSFPWK
jgi:hypothetical protein